MSCNNAGCVILRYSRATNDERDVDVLFVTARLAWLEAVLTDMISIIAAINDIGIFHNSIIA